MGILKVFKKKTVNALFLWSAVVSIGLSGLAYTGCGSIDDEDLSNQDENQQVDYLDFVYGMEDEVASEIGFEIDFIGGLSWDEAYIRDVTVDASQVNIDLAGTYAAIYWITAVDGTVLNKEVSVLVIDLGDNAVAPTEEPTEEPTVPTGSPDAPTANTAIFLWLILLIFFFKKLKPAIPDAYTPPPKMTTS